MKKITILLAAFFAIALTASAQFRMVGIGSWTSLGGGSYSATVTFSADLTGNNFLPGQITTAFELVTGTPTTNVLQRFDITAVSNQTLTQADITVLQISPTNSAPAAFVMVFNPNGLVTIPQVPFASAGTTGQLQAAVDTYNAQITAPRGSRLFRTNNNYATFISPPAGTPDIGDAVWNMDMGLMAIKTGADTYASITMYDGRLVKTGDRHYKAANLDNWDVTTHSAATLAILTGSSGIIGNPINDGAIQRGGTVVVQVLNQVANPSTITFGNRYRDTYGNALAPFIVGAESEMTFEFSVDSDDDNTIQIYRMMNPLGGGGSIAVQDLVNGLDITNVNDTIRVAYDFLELANTAIANDDSLLVYDKSLGAYRKASAASIAALYVPVPVSDDTKVTKNGDSPTGALVIGTNNNENVAIERNNVQEIILQSGNVDFTGNDFSNVGIANVGTLAVTNGMTANYSTYTTSANLNDDYAHYVDGTADVTMTVTTANFADGDIFFVKNQDVNLKVTIAAGAGLTTLGQVVITPQSVGWFQRRGSFVERIDPQAGWYTTKQTITTNSAGEFNILHPFGNVNPKYANAIIKTDSTQDPALVYYSFYGNGVVTFTCYDPASSPLQHVQVINREFQILLNF